MDVIHQQDATRRGKEENRDAIRIVADLDDPNQNIPFRIYPKRNIAGLDGISFYEGIVITLKVDPGWIMDCPNEDVFSMNIISPNEILAKIVLADWVTTMCYDYATPQFHEDIADVLDNDRHYFLEDIKERKYSYFIIEFPKNYVLSSEVIYNEGGRDKKLKLGAQKVTYPEILDKNGTPLSSKGNLREVAYVWWTAARIDIRPMKRGKVDFFKKRSRSLQMFQKLSRKAKQEKEEKEEKEETKKCQKEKAIKQSSSRSDDDADNNTAKVEEEDNDDEEILIR